MEKLFRGVCNENHANKWEFAMVSGNGKQGVMVFGDPRSETIIGNHTALYLPQANDYQVPNMASYLDEFRKMIKEQDYELAQKFYYEKAKEVGYQGLQMSDPSHPGVHLLIQMAVSEISNYRRYTNFENGEIGVRFDDQYQVRHLRRTFVSRADDLIVHHMTNDILNVSCTLEIGDYDEPLLERERIITEETLKLRHKYVHGLGGYDVDIQLIAPGGHLSVISNGVRIEHAKEVMILMRIHVYQGLENVRDIIFDLSERPLCYDILLARHQKKHQELFNRVKLNIATDEQRSRLTEDLIHQAQKEKELPLALIEKMYDAGRYMFICSAGDLIPNLPPLACQVLLMPKQDIQN